MKPMRWLRATSKSFEDFAAAALPSAGAWHAFTHGSSQLPDGQSLTSVSHRDSS